MYGAILTRSSLPSILLIWKTLSALFGLKHDGSFTRQEIYPSFWKCHWQEYIVSHRCSFHAVGTRVIPQLGNFDYCSKKEMLSTFLFTEGEVHCSVENFSSNGTWTWWVRWAETLNNSWHTWCTRKKRKKSKDYEN